MPDFRLILVDPKLQMCAAWQDVFRGHPSVAIIPGRFEELASFDCMVSAANSFGLMDGGVDGAITRFFGVSLMERVQTRILNEYHGEQPVGTSMIVETFHPEHSYIAHTPTMRIPMSIAGTDAVYRAMWAMLVAVRQHNLTSGRTIKTVACPGLGTATGRVPFGEAARQMALAYRNFHNPPSRIDWQFAVHRQQEIG